MMRGILIDPFEHVVKEVQVGAGGLEPFYEMLGCRMVQYIRVGPRINLIVDEEYNIRGGAQRYFYLDGNQDHPLGGKALLLGEIEDEEGVENDDLPDWLDVRRVAPTIEWADPRLTCVGFRNEPFKENHPVFGTIEGIRQVAEFDLVEKDDPPTGD
jgi:hypothetical protein